MDECQNNYTEWKKPDKKEDILHESIHIKFIELQTEKHISKRNREAGERGCKRAWGVLGVMDVFIILIMAIVSRLCAYAKSY